MIPSINNREVIGALNVSAVRATGDPVAQNTNTVANRVISEVIEPAQNRRGIEEEGQVQNKRQRVRVAERGEVRVTVKEILRNGFSEAFGVDLESLDEEGFEEFLQETAPFFPSKKQLAKLLDKKALRAPTDEDETLLSIINYSLSQESLKNVGCKQLATTHKTIAYIIENRDHFFNELKEVVNNNKDFNFDDNEVVVLNNNSRSSRFLPNNTEAINTVAKETLKKGFSEAFDIDFEDEELETFFQEIENILPSKKQLGDLLGIKLRNTDPKELMRSVIYYSVSSRGLASKDATTYRVISNISKNPDFFVRFKEVIDSNRNGAPLQNSNPSQTKNINRNATNKIAKQTLKKGFSDALGVSLDNYHKVEQLEPLFREIDDIFPTIEQLGDLLGKQLRKPTDPKDVIRSLMRYSISSVGLSYEKGITQNSYRVLEYITSHPNFFNDLKEVIDSNRSSGSSSSSSSLQNRPAAQNVRVSRVDSLIDLILGQN